MRTKYEHDQLIALDQCTLAGSFDGLHPSVKETIKAGVLITAIGVGGAYNLLNDLPTPDELEIVLAEEPVASDEPRTYGEDIVIIETSSSSTISTTLAPMPELVIEPSEDGTVRFVTKPNSGQILKP